MRSRAWPALALAAALTLTSCTGDPEPTEPSTAPTETSEPTETPEPSEATDEPTDEPSSTASEQPALLDWQQVPGPVADQVTVSGKWSLTLPESGATASLDGPDPRYFDALPGYRFTEALIDGAYAVVVAEHEQATRPNVVSVVDLESGETTDADTLPGVGGSWALGSGLLATTVRQGKEFCVAVADLLAGGSNTGPCVPPRHGISNVTVSPAGIAAMTFDDGRPSCRTLNRVEGSAFEPLAGVEECRGWEAVVTESAAVWGVVPQERRIEASEFYADSGSGPVELGPGTTGTLTWCGDAAYVVRDPQRDSDPARLLRIDPTGSTEVVYESASNGRAFLSAPRCGGTDLTLTAFTADGDEQVTASVR
ncbi:MAG: hypothetical protein WKF50_02920 [Nocardioides sp.]